MTRRTSWATRIEAAKKRGKFTQYEVKLATNSWTTCAVGERHSRNPIPNWDYLAAPPLDSNFSPLGLAFGHAVERQYIALAESLYNQIMALP